MIHKNDYKHTIFWASLTLVPFLLQVSGMISSNDYAISKDNGIFSIISGVLMHGNWSHMLGNLLGMLLGVSLVVKFYSRAYVLLMFLGYICPAIVMYATGHKAIGISGLVYTLLWYIIIAGLTSRVKEKFYVGIIVLIIYGSGLRNAVPPSMPTGIAWQAHLTGVCVAMFLAIVYKLRKIY